MNLLKYVPNSVTRSIGRAGLKMSAKSPTLLFVGGLASVMTGTVLACRATVKAQDAIESFRAEVADLGTADAATKETSDHKKDLAYVYGKNTLHIAKLYAPAIVIGGVGIACLTGSHVQLMRRNNALMAAYAALQAAYENYRKRVQEEVGVERELDLYHSAHNEKILGANGKDATVKVADPNTWSPYARFFNGVSDHFKDDGELNRLWVQCQQEYLNNLLRARGHVFLNEAYDALGLPRSSAGQCVGWVMNGDGDNFIDFGLFNAYQAQNNDPREPELLLDFNVDGVVFDQLDKLRR